MRRPKQKTQPNHERWLVSYADFITLLFAFFVVMFASSQADHGKARRASAAVQAAFDGPPNATQTKGVAPAAPRASAELEPALKQLLHELRHEIETGKMNVRMEPRGLVVSLSEASFFPPGEDTIATQNLASLGKVADAIRSLPNLVRSEGHTDSVPIHTPRFRDNWDLSAARAIAVMNVLRDSWGISAERLAITGYGDTVPMEPNDTEAGRARNRRVDIVILNTATSRGELAARNVPRP